MVLNKWEYNDKKPPSQNSRRQTQTQNSYFKQQKRRKISLKVKNISTNDGQKKSINLGLKYNKVYAAKCILK